MARAPCDFREMNVRRAVRAIKSAGKQVASVEIDNDDSVRIKLKNGDNDADKP